MDTLKARLWLKKSADMNETGAMILLGEIYLEGKIENQDIEKATYWFKKSCDLGNENGCGHLKSLPQK